jgi:hypothetical protein
MTITTAWQTVLCLPFYGLSGTEYVAFLAVIAYLFFRVVFFAATFAFLVGCLALAWLLIGVWALALLFRLSPEEVWRLLTFLRLALAALLGLCRLAEEACLLPLFAVLAWDRALVSTLAWELDGRLAWLFFFFWRLIRVSHLIAFGVAVALFWSRFLFLYQGHLRYTIV